MNLVAELKQAGQDHQWYPTSQRMLDLIEPRVKDAKSILDVGAGNGSSLDYLSGEHTTKYAIEKSSILIENMNPDIFIIGTNFHEQTFIDKRVDIIFCNPPYSEFAIWMEKLILEANCNYLYFVVPERWKENKLIQDAIKRRKATVFRLGSDTFEDSEFRKARANVEILEIGLKSGYSSGQYSCCTVDPFEVWFETSFPQPEPLERKEETRREQIAGLVKKDLVKNLVLFYEQDRDHLLDNYTKVQGLDPAILKELKVDTKAVKEGLELKIKGLKNLYWKELFNRLDSITNRLTARTRKKMLDKLSENTSVDFTETNIYSVVIWAIKNANKYFDEQLVEVYKDLTQKENVIGYKSNHHILDDDWRFRTKWEFQKGVSHYKLDYRLIHEKWHAIQLNRWQSYDYPGGLSTSAHEIIGDVCTIGKNLGFDVLNDSTEREWKAGGKQEFYFGDELFMEVKAHKNGNIHFKLNQDFLCRWNVEFGRIMGWLRNPHEACDELEISFEDATKYFKSNLQLANNNIKLLTE